MIQTPASLAAEMQRHLGVAPDEIIDDGRWHSAKGGKVSYVTDESKHGGLIVRYRDGGEFKTWYSWDHSDGKGEYIRSAPRKPPDDMPVMLKIWQESGKVSTDHPYISRKRIMPISGRPITDIGNNPLKRVLNIRQARQSYTIREATGKDARQYLSARTLLLPAFCNATGKLQAFKTIPEKPGALKLSRGPLSNCHYWIGGSPATGDGRLYVSESYSTGTSIHMRTQSPVLVAFDTNGLKPAGEMLRSRYPDAQIIFACDNDRHDDPNKRNDGVYKATAAAQAIGAALLLPPMEGKADWNDWHISQCPKTKTPARF